MIRPGSAFGEPNGGLGIAASSCRFGTDFQPIILLGGSFNPAHGGHRQITLRALHEIGAREAWWLVSPGNPLKPAAGMAPLAARYASALRQARRAPIQVTAIERELGTRYTADTLRALLRRFPRHRFVWLMGSDNLAQFHRWRDWRAIARMMPIAVVLRPGYDAAAMASPAMAWLRRYRVPAAALSCGKRSAPALVILRFDPDPRSASALRRRTPDWAAQERTHTLRDRLTRTPLITSISPMQTRKRSTKTLDQPAARPGDPALDPR